MGSQHQSMAPMHHFGLYPSAASSGIYFPSCDIEPGTETFLLECSSCSCLISRAYMPPPS